MMNHKIIPLLSLLIFDFLSALDFDSLSYYQKFDIAVEHYKQGRYELSKKQFKNILINENSFSNPSTQLMIAKSNYRLGNYEEARVLALSIIRQFHESPYHSDVLILLGDISLSKGKPTDAFMNYLKARPYVEDVLYLNDIDERIYKCIGMGLNEETLEEILSIEKNYFNRAIINLSKAYGAWVNGRGYDLEVIMDDIDTFHLPGYFSGIFGNLHDSKTSDLEKTLTIAIILPISGFEKEKGQAYLLGLSEYFSLKDNSYPLRFLVYDTKGSPSKVLQIIQELQANANIICSLGPITRDEILCLSGFNSKFPILIPKSNLSISPKISNSLLFLSPTPGTIAQRTAQFMIKELKLDKIAVISPADKQSKKITDNFINACYQLGVDPIAIEWYVEKPEDLSRQLKSLRRAAWNLFPEEKSKKIDRFLKIDSLDALFDVDVTDFFELPPDEEDKLNSRDSAKIILETIQGIYIPLRADELTYIGTQLPLYNLKSILVGNEQWLNLPLLNEPLIGPHVDGMYFLTDVSSALSNNYQDVFTNYYVLGREHAIYLDTFSKNGVKDRNSFFDKLQVKNIFHGKFISVMLDGKSNENRLSQIIKYTNSKIKRIGAYDGKSIIKGN